MQVSGLSSSGIDVASIVNQLMQVEAIPQQQLMQKKITALSTQTSWSSLNTALSTLGDAVNALSTPAAASATTASSSDTARATITANGTAAPQNATFQISSLASAQQLMSTSFSSTGDKVGAGTLVVSSGTSAAGVSGLSVDPNALADGHHTFVVNTVTAAAADGTPGSASVTLDGENYTVNLDGSAQTVGGLTFTPGSNLTPGNVDFTSVTTTADSTVSDLAAALNTAGGPAVGAALDLGNGNGARLVLTAASTGTSGALTLSGTGDLGTVASSMSVNRDAADAVVQMGGLTITRSSNTISDMIPGATVQLLKADPAGTTTGNGTNVSVTIARDANGISSKAQALVNAVNGVFSQVDTLTSYDQDKKVGGPLFGDSRPTQLVQDIYSALDSVVGSGKTQTLAQLGIQVQRDGTYTFDSSQLSKQLAQDPTGVTNLLSKAAVAVQNVQQAATGTPTTTGWIKTAQDGAAQNVKDIQTSIDAWNTRLSTMQDTYTKQFTALDVAVNSMKMQQQWLSSQLGSLPAPSGSSISVGS
jgi:flagellar hook-associated protein 2